MMSLTSAGPVPSFYGLLQYLRKRLSQCNTKLAQLGDKYIQREELVTFLKDLFAELNSQLAASLLDCNPLWAANNVRLKNHGTDRKELFRIDARVLEVDAGFQAPRASPSNLADAARDQDYYEVLLHFNQFRFKGFMMVMPTLCGVVQAVMLLFAMALVLYLKSSRILFWVRST